MTLRAIFSWRRNPKPTWQAALQSLENATHKRCLELEMQIDALLRERAASRKEPLEFVTVPAQGERVEVRRKAGA